MLRQPVLIAAFLITTFSHAQVAGDTWQKVRSEGVGKVTVLQFNEPRFFAYNSEKNEWEGIYAEMLESFVAYLKEEMNVTLTYSVDNTSSDFLQCYERIKNGSGGVFGIGSTAINTQREREVSFTSPVLTLGMVLVTGTETPTITQMRDIQVAFSGYTAYTEKGSIGETAILDLKSKFNLDNEIKYTTGSRIPEKIAADPRSFTYLGISFVLGSQQKGLKYHKVGNISGTEVGFTFPKGSDWAPVFNEFLAANGGYINSDAFKNSLIRHFGNSGAKLISSMQK